MMVKTTNIISPQIDLNMGKTADDKWKRVEKCACVDTR